MKGTFEFELKDGRKCTLEANYECKMITERMDADGYIMPGKTRPFDSPDNYLVMYVDGKEVDRCRYSNSWRLVDVQEMPGVKRIQGLNLGFSDNERAEKYEKWISEIMDGGKTDEVKAYEKEKKEKEIRGKIGRAKKTIMKAERQKDIPTKKEAARRMKAYNDFMNEGGDGYVPYIISIEDYEYAKKVLEEYEN